MSDSNDNSVELTQIPIDVEASPQATKPKGEHDVWNTEQIKYVKEHVQKSKSMMWIHERSSRTMMMRHYCLTIPTLFFSSAISAAEIGRDSTGSDVDGFSPMRIAMLAMASAFLTSISNLMKYGERSQCHTNTVKQYQKLVLEMETTVLLDDKPNFANYITMVINTQENISNSAPTPPMSIIGWFNRRFEPELDKLPFMYRK